MRKLFLSLFLALALTPGKAQSFLGCQYGTAYQEALNYYREKYHDSVSTEGQQVIIQSPNVCGCVFDCAIANFTMNGKRSKLNGGVMFLEKDLNQAKEIKERQEKLIGRLVEKYPNECELTTDDNGFKVLSFGKKAAQGKRFGVITVVLKPKENVCALVLNYRPVLSADNDDL